MSRDWEIIGAPYDLAARSAGAADAPGYVRDHYFRKWIPNLGRFWGISVSDGGDVSPPRQTGDPVANLAAYSQLLFSRVLSSLESGHTPLVLGGDHSVTLGSVSAAKAYLRKTEGSASNLGLLWIDAHADLNTDPGGSLHGRVASFLVGEGPPKLTAIRPPAPQVQPRHLAALGIRDLMPYERDLCEKHAIQLTSMRQMDKGGVRETCSAAIASLQGNTEGFYLSFDIDAAAGEQFGACATPEIGGFSARECLTIIELAVQSPRFIGMDIVEYCPGMDTDGNTLSLVTQLLHSALGYRTQF